jgi:hypothetical protein
VGVALGIIAGCLLLGSSVKCLASTPELQEKLQQAVNAIWEADVADPALRSQLARAGEAYWVSFDSRIRELTEKENEYLDEFNPPRGLRSLAEAHIWAERMNSPTSALRSVKQHAGECRKLHEKLTRVIGSGASEQLAWLKIASCYSYSQLYDLNKVGLSDGRPNGAFRMENMDRVLQTMTSRIADALTQ